MKKIYLAHTIKDFEDFVNRTDIEVISVDVKVVENSYQFQENFAGVIYYKLLTPLN